MALVTDLVEELFAEIILIAQDDFIKVTPLSKVWGKINLDPIARWVQALNLRAGDFIKGQLVNINNSVQHKDGGFYQDLSKRKAVKIFFTV